MSRISNATPDLYLRSLRQSTRASNSLRIYGVRPGTISLECRARVSRFLGAEDKSPYQTVNADLLPERFTPLVEAEFLRLKRGVSPLDISSFSLVGDGSLSNNLSMALAIRLASTFSFMPCTFISFRWTQTPNLGKRRIGEPRSGVQKTRIS
jgi:hypothetical protein